VSSPALASYRDNVFLQANYSFSGAFRPLSKLIVCAVMLRGRHRGLPVAIDRAVMLPAEFRASQPDEEHEEDDGLGGDTTKAAPRSVPPAPNQTDMYGTHESPLNVTRTRTRHSLVNNGTERASLGFKEKAVA
jgi:hypothetical protein